MSRSPAVPGRLRRSAAALAGTVLALGLTACGAGLDAQTYQERTVADGTNTSAGAIAVRNIAVQAPPEESGYEPGDDAPVTFTLTNDGPEDDRLLEASSPAATSVEIVAEGETVEQVPLRALGTTGSQVGLVLRGLEQEQLRPGEYVEITLRFERGGSVTVQVPVATLARRGPREVSENFEHEE